MIMKGGEHHRPPPCRLAGCGVNIIFAPMPLKHVHQKPADLSPNTSVVLLYRNIKQKHIHPVSNALTTLLYASPWIPAFPKRPLDLHALGYPEHETNLLPAEHQHLKTLSGLSRQRPPRGPCLDSPGETQDNSRMVNCSTTTSANPD